MPFDLGKYSKPGRGDRRQPAEPGSGGVADFFNRDILSFKKGLNDTKKEMFYSEMSVLLASGVDIRTALEIVAGGQKTSEMRQFFNGIYECLLEGRSLSDSVKIAGSFTAFEYYSLRIGEESGRIREVLADLSVYYSKKIKQRRQLVNALTYPLLVTITAFIAVFFMLKFIVPMFTDVFSRFQGELPAMTRFIIRLSDTFSEYLGVFVVIIIAVVAAMIIIRKKEWYRRKISALTLKMPVIGPVINKIYLARFCQGMALLTGARVPMLESIRLVGKMMGFYPFETALVSIENDILHGSSLHQSMERFPLFDRRIRSLTRVAEEINQLDKIYTKLNIQYSEELSHQIGILGDVLEPVMIIVTGLLVAVILISMYLPMFQLSTSIM